MADCCTEENVDGAILKKFTASYPVIYLTLSFLSWKNLCRVARVCVLWRDIVSKLKSERNTMGFTYCRVPETDNADAAEELDNFFEDLYTQPGTVIMFTSEDMLCSSMKMNWVKRSRSGSGNRSRNRTQKCNFRDMMLELLPPKCELIGIEAAGIIGTSKSQDQVEEIESEKAMALLCLPKTELEISCCNSRSGAPNIEAALHDQEIKAILLLNTDVMYNPRTANVLKDKFPNCALAGAFVEQIVYTSSHPSNDVEEDFLDNVCVSIYGNNVTTASVVIKRSCTTPQKVEDRIKKLKNYGLPEKKSFAFMFACLGRGESFYGEPNIESTIFKKHFPHTPLVGLFGNGEIGCDFVDSAHPVLEQPECKRKKDVSVSALYHSYATVIMLVSIT